jgi:CRISPR/Cas system-associated exonuclease Cas4 (RecB family)
MMDQFEQSILEMKRQEYRLQSDLNGYVLKAIQEAEKGPKKDESRIEPYVSRCSFCKMELRGGGSSSMCQSCRGDAYDYP